MLCSFSSTKNIIVVGDLNIDISRNSVDLCSPDYLNLVDSYGYIIGQSIHYRHNNKNNNTKNHLFVHVGAQSV